MEPSYSERIEFTKFVQMTFFYTPTGTIMQSIGWILCLSESGSPSDALFVLVCPPITRSWRMVSVPTLMSGKAYLSQILVSFIR